MLCPPCVASGWVDLSRLPALFSSSSRGVECGVMLFRRVCGGMLRIAISVREKLPFCVPKKLPISVDQHHQTQQDQIPSHHYAHSLYIVLGKWLSIRFRLAAISGLQCTPWDRDAVETWLVITGMRILFAEIKLPRYYRLLSTIVRVRW